MEPHLLDNPIWHMLCHDLAGFAVGTRLARRCDPAVVAFAALADHGDQAVADLADLYSANETTSVYVVDPPRDFSGFAIRARLEVDQLVCQGRTPAPEPNGDVTSLTSDDAGDIAQLLKASGLGTLRPPLVDLGHFVGIRHDGQLVAMAGERMHLPGYCEVAAVCTHPDWRGRGYARLLSAIVTESIWERGKTPFLHVLPHNTAAYRVYSALHFVKRGEMTNLILTRRQA